MKYGLNLITRDFISALLSLVLIGLLFVFAGASIFAQTSASSEESLSPTTVTRNVGNAMDRNSADIIEAIRSREAEITF